jgi:hypothetical protein
MSGLSKSRQAGAPRPTRITDGMIEAFRDALLEWQGGPKAFAYDVGCRTVFEAVLRAAREDGADT